MYWNMCPIPFSYRKAASLLKDSGYLYIEVPQELSDQVTTRLANGDKTIRLDIHEHINRYSVKSVTELLRSARLSVAAIQAEEVDFGWSKATMSGRLPGKAELPNWLHDGTGNT